ncbi:MAG: hypothetical protein ACRD5B_19035, partial [Nitrososphaeraceae archaeon]
MYTISLKRSFALMILSILGVTLPALNPFIDGNGDIYATITTANNQEAITNTTAVATNAIISDLFNKIKDSVIEIITVGNVINPKITIDGTPLVYGG